MTKTIKTDKRKTFELIVSVNLSVAILSGCLAISTKDLGLIILTICILLFTRMYVGFYND